MATRFRRRPGLQALPSFLSTPWTGASCFKVVHEFNERFVRAITSVAREGDQGTMPEVVWIHRDLWPNLDAAAIRHMSQCPFLLANIHFRSATWWQQARNVASSPGGAPGPVPLFSGERAVELMWEAILIARRTIRVDTRDAAILLGMSSDVASVVADLGLGDLQHIAHHHHRHLRPRWEHRSAFWGKLLDTASHDDREALYELRLYAFQMADADSGPAASTPGDTEGVRHG